MSITSGMNPALSAGLAQQTSILAQLQEQISSGLRVNRASDDPASAFKIMGLRSRLSDLDAFRSNLSHTLENFDQASSVLTGLSNIMVRAGELASQGATGTYSQSQRQAMASEISALLDQVVALANTEFRGQYLFGGTNDDGPPFLAESTNGEITSVTYQGAGATLSAPVAPGMAHEVVLIGDGVFGGQRVGTPTFLGDTGVQAGSGTSSVQGDVWLVLTHDTTTYGGATGVAAGASSGAGDTILGTGHTLTIDADAGTVRLDGGVAVAYNIATDSDLQLTNTEGDTVYVDMTGLNPALTGTVAVSMTATGNMSIDDMATSIPLTAFADGQVISDSQTGRALFLDTTDVARVGTDLVQIEGTYDIFSTLISARDALNNRMGVSDGEQSALVSSARQLVETTLTEIGESVARIGARAQALDGVRSTLDDQEGALEASRSTIEDADLTELIVQLTQAETSYQTLLATTARMQNMSLLNYL